VVLALKQQTRHDVNFCCLYRTDHNLLSNPRMARKRQRRRPAASTAADHQGHHTNLDRTAHDRVNLNGDKVVIRRISTQDEGVLYTHKITVSGAGEFSTDGDVYL
jgi:hypothetical protein